MPDMSFEEAARARGFSLICGVDEVGRGCLAGRVVVAACILPWPVANSLGSLLNDSKALSKKRRERAEEVIIELSQIGLGSASVHEIESLNILQATMLAMRRAVAALPVKPDYVLVDGNRSPDFEGIQFETVIKGDALSMSIAAASIIAKEARDREMTRLAEEFPHYGWDRNAGYGTADHLAAIQTHGVTPHHRRTFGPVAEYLQQRLEIA